MEVGKAGNPEVYLQVGSGGPLSHCPAPMEGWKGKAGRGLTRGQERCEKAKGRPRAVSA